MHIFSSSKARPERYGCQDGARPVPGDRAVESSFVPGMTSTNSITAPRIAWPAVWYGVMRMVYQWPSTDRTLCSRTEIALMASATACSMSRA